MVENNKTETKVKVKALEKNKTLIYLGPSLPGGKLKSNSVFNGTDEGIRKHIEHITGTYPEVLKLLVPPEELAIKKAKVNASGNVLNKYYNDILKRISEEV